MVALSYPRGGVRSPRTPPATWSASAQRVLTKRIEDLLIGDSCQTPDGYIPARIERTGNSAYEIAIRGRRPITIRHRRNPGIARNDVLEFIAHQPVQLTLPGFNNLPMQS